MVYVFDTNSLRVLGNYYPKTFPTLWEHLDDAAGNGAILSVREVRREVKVQIPDGWYLAWLLSKKGFFVIPSAAETTFVAEIFGVAHFRALVGAQQRLKGQPVADPFIIAAAKVREGTVVTEEALKPHAAKIPNVCQHFGVRCINVEHFMAENGWKF